LIDLNVNSLEAGNGYHSVVVGWKRRETVMLWSLDAINSSFGLPSPTHFKIDVERGEMEVLKGARSLLQNKSLKHLLVEVKDDEDRNKVKTFLAEFGWRLSTIDKENLIFVK